MAKTAQSVEHSSITENLKFLRDYLSTRGIPHFAVTLPMCPSMNAYWRNFRGHTILSKDAREYKKQAELVLAGASGPHFGDKKVDVLIVMYFHDKRKRDVDNRIKPVLDVLKGIVFDDDSQVVICCACKLQSNRTYMEIIVAEH